MSHFDFPRDEWAWFAEKFGSNIPTYTSKSPLRVMIQIHQVPPLDFGAPVRFFGQTHVRAVVGSQAQRGYFEPSSVSDLPMEPTIFIHLPEKFPKFTDIYRTPWCLPLKLGFCMVGL